MKKSIIIDVISYLLVLLFVYTGASKLLSYGFFYAQLHKQPLPEAILPVLSVAVPVGEILVATCLLVPRFRKVGFFASLLLMSAFTLYVGYILKFVPGNKLPCTCGGVINMMSWRQHLVFNSFFTFLALVGFYLERKQSYPEQKKMLVV
ncbi:MauE/DoxX family redox-associated membrane protein [Chitinophaga sp. 22321]|uniref:Methylamine utilisation protein MauE domain-containing protein n=1 Tax=Chitinophaga hostae TaxID=2831022 RepID=A0ABS5JA11_9BACT|nr:MauE/DoxX family redox-associated membrane protein [Chitinophaga hostae]MBS0032043.1 hypothetical protein [Chitinophaga hostae]